MALTKNMQKWDMRFLQMASHVSSWSKDPSTKTGAVIVRPDRTIASVGYNGFPRNLRDDPRQYLNREIKYELMVHCEVNAMTSAREALHGYTLYVWPFTCCTRCAVQVMQAGITRVVSVTPSEDALSRWANSFHRAVQLFEQAGIAYEEYNYVAEG